MTMTILIRTSTTCRPVMSCWLVWPTAELPPSSEPKRWTASGLEPTNYDVRCYVCPRDRSGLVVLTVSSSRFDSGRPCGLRAACRVLPPALLHRLIVLAGARTRIGRLGVPIALEKEAEAVVAMSAPYGVYCRFSPSL